MVYESRTLKPHVIDTSAFAWQEFPAVKSVQMMYGDSTYRMWFCEPQIDGDAAAAILSELERAPVGYAATVRTKMKADFSIPPSIDLS
jgi:hypothetical protein